MTQLPKLYHILADDEEKNWPQMIATSEAKLFQLRSHHLELQKKLAHAKALRPLVKEHQARLLVNLPYQVFLEIPDVLPLLCDGIHLTHQEIISLASNQEVLSRFQEAKASFSSDWLLAASCHDIVSLQAAGVVGADFVTLSPILKTTSHRDVKPLGWQMFKTLSAASCLAVFALGGLSPVDLPIATRHGAHGVAGITGFKTLKSSLI